MATAEYTGANDVLFSARELPVETTGMQSMASKMWVPFIGMGFMIVVAAFVIGLVVSSSAADYYAVSIDVREAAVTGADLATKLAFVESTKAWLPTLKFLGMGMLLGGVTFLLATILGAFRVGGGRVQEALGVEVRILKPPMTARIFPTLMMMGMMVLMASLVVGIVLATQTYDYWNHSIAAQLNPDSGALLADLGTIKAIGLWLAPLKFVGLAMVLTSIGLALATIVRALRWQSSRLWEVLS